MSGRVLVWAGVGAAVVAAVVLAVFWRVQGLEQAGWLAGVLSAFAALSAFVMALPHRPARPGPEPGQPEPGQPGGAPAEEPARQTAPGSTINTISGGINTGPLVMGRDIVGPVASSPQTSLPTATPPSQQTAPDPHSSAEPESRPEPEPGAVSNVFSGWMNQGPLVMGRDIIGPVTSGAAPAHPPATAPPAQASGNTPGEPASEPLARGAQDEQPNRPAGG